MEQTSLFGEMPKEYEQDENAKRFWKFHQENPEVYHWLVRAAKTRMGEGYPKYGIGALWEQLRWHVRYMVKTDDKPRLCNTHRAYYARLIMKHEPDLAEFFVVRDSKADEEIEGVHQR